MQPQAVEVRTEPVDRVTVMPVVPAPSSASVSGPVCNMLAKAEDVMVEAAPNSEMGPEADEVNNQSAEVGNRTAPVGESPNAKSSIDPSSGSDPAEKHALSSSVSTTGVTSATTTTSSVGTSNTTTIATTSNSSKDNNNNNNNDNSNMEMDANGNDSRVTGGRWSAEEDERLRQVVKEHGPKNWKLISKVAFDGSRTDVQCLHRWQKVLRPGLVKGPWTKEEDEVIVNLISTYGMGNIKWSEIAAALPGRLGKQCRERWVNHLDPNLKKGPWTEEEDRTLMQQQVLLGNRWRDIAAHLPGRSENSVKNRWNSARRKHKRSQAAAAAAALKDNGVSDRNAGNSDGRGGASKSLPKRPSKLARASKTASRVSRGGTATACAHPTSASDAVAVEGADIVVEDAICGIAKEDHVGAVVDGQAYMRTDLLEGAKLTLGTADRVKAAANGKKAATKATSNARKADKAKRGGNAKRARGSKADVGNTAIDLDSRDGTQASDSAVGAKRGRGSRKGAGRGGRALKSDGLYGSSGADGSAKQPKQSKKQLGEQQQKQQQQQQQQQHQQHQQQQQHHQQQQQQISNNVFNALLGVTGQGASNLSLASLSGFPGSNVLGSFPGLNMLPPVIGSGAEQRQQQVQQQQQQQQQQIQQQQQQQQHSQQPNLAHGPVAGVPGTDFNNPQFQQAMLMGMAGLGPPGSMSPTFLNNSLFGMSGLGLGMGDPMALMMQQQQQLLGQHHHQQQHPHHYHHHLQHGSNLNRSLPSPKHQSAIHPHLVMGGAPTIPTLGTSGGVGGVGGRCKSEASSNNTSKTTAAAATAAKTKVKAKAKVKATTKVKAKSKAKAATAMGDADTSAKKKATKASATPKISAAHRKKKQTAAALSAAAAAVAADLAAAEMNDDSSLATIASLSVSSRRLSSMTNKRKANKDNSSNSNSNIDLPGLQIVGSALTEKQKALLHEPSVTRSDLSSAAGAAGSSVALLPSESGESSPSSTSPQSQQRKPSSGEDHGRGHGRFHDGFEVLGMRNIDNLPLNPNDEHEAFELFTFDDLVGDMSDLYQANHGAGSGAGAGSGSGSGTNSNNSNDSNNSRSPASTSPTVEAPTSATAVPGNQAASPEPTSMGSTKRLSESDKSLTDDVSRPSKLRKTQGGSEIPERVEGNDRHNNIGFGRDGRSNAPSATALHPRPLSPSTVNALLGHMAPTS